MPPGVLITNASTAPDKAPLLDGMLRRFYFKYSLDAILMK